MSADITSASDAEQRTLLPVATGPATWREVARASEGHRLRFAGVFVLGLVSAALGIVVPSVLGWFVDQASEGAANLSTVALAVALAVISVILSAIGSALTIVIDLSEHRHERVLQASWSVVPHAMRARTVQNMFFTRLNVAEYLGLAAILVVGFLLIGAGLSTVGAATTAMLLVIRLFGPVNRLLFVIDDLRSALASLTRIVGVITIPVDTSRETESEGDLSLASPSESAAVRLEGVGFAYGSGPAVLDDVDFVISAGECVAVVGPSGAGKTTLAGVVAGIHRADSGTRVRPERAVLVTQEIHVFAGTLRDNLTLAAPEAGDDDVLAALDALGASALLDVLPEGLDTVLGVGGHALTAAQAQQLALTRVLLANPELVILDEATAEAGSAQAGLLDRASERVLRGRTGIVVAHRLSQAAACDRIVVLDSGRIIEDGTHDELLAAGGSYAGLWEKWQRARKIERVE